MSPRGQINVVGSSLLRPTPQMGGGRLWVKKEEEEEEDEEGQDRRPRETEGLSATSRPCPGD